VKFGGQLTGVEWAASEVAVADLNRGNFAPTVVHADDEVLGIGIVFDVHFAEFDAAIFQEGLCAAAIGAPQSAIDDDGFHSKALTRDWQAPLEFDATEKRSAPTSEYITPSSIEFDRTGVECSE
jgi:hypothetical protein